MHSICFATLSISNGCSPAVAVDCEEGQTVEWYCVNDYDKDGCSDSIKKCDPGKRCDPPLRGGLVSCKGAPITDLRPEQPYLYHTYASRCQPSESQCGK
jgi:hypothetical protein